MRHCSASSTHDDHSAEMLALSVTIARVPAQPSTENLERHIRLVAREVWRCVPMAVGHWSVGGSQPLTGSSSVSRRLWIVRYTRRFSKVEVDDARYPPQAPEETQVLCPARHRPRCPGRPSNVRGQSGTQGLAHLCGPTAPAGRCFALPSRDYRPRNSERMATFIHSSRRDRSTLGRRISPLRVVPVRFHHV